MSNIVQFTPQESLLEDLLHQISYELGTRPLPFMRRELALWLENCHVSHLMLELILSDTLLAPRPSWAYFRAIVQRCLCEGVTTFEAYKERQANFHRRKRTTVLDEIV